MAHTTLPVTPEVTVIPAAALRGVASGVLFMAVFGTAWATIGIEGLQGWGSRWLSLIAVLVGITLLSGGIALLRASRRLSSAVTEANARKWKRKGRWFGITFGAEGLLIGVASAVCGATNRFDLFYPVMALIVGVHFFPLAALFQVKVHYLAGALLCVLAVLTLLMVPERGTLGSQPIMSQWVVVGFGAALILWGVGAWLWLLGNRLLASQNQ